jgi:hypothetical protein
MAKSSRAAQGLKRAHDDDAPFTTSVMPPLQQPPKVQTLTTIK